MASNNGFVSKNTSLITILSSVHGRLRHEQRDIDKRDLQRALKYRTYIMKRGHHRWTVEYDGITFITNPTMTRERAFRPSRRGLAASLSSSSSSSYSYSSDPRYDAAASRVSSSCRDVHPTTTMTRRKSPTIRPLNPLREMDSTIGNRCYRCLIN